MKVPIPYNQYSFTSSLSKDELLAQLNDYLAKSRDDRSYDGKIKDDKFEIKRITGYRKRVYVLNGTVSPARGGSTVSIEIAPRLFFFLLRIVLLPIFLLNFFDGYSHPNAETIIEVLLIALLWGGISYLFIWMGFRKELKRSKEFLLAFFTGTENDDITINN